MTPKESEKSVEQQLVDNTHRLATMKIIADVGRSIGKPIPFTNLASTIAIIANHQPIRDNDISLVLLTTKQVK